MQYIIAVTEIIINNINNTSFFVCVCGRGWGVDNVLWYIKKGDSSLFHAYKIHT